MEEEEAVKQAVFEHGAASCHPHAEAGVVDVGAEEGGAGGEVLET